MSIFLTHTTVDEVLYSGSIKHCKCSENESYCDPCNWAERDANLLEKRI